MQYKVVVITPSKEAVDQIHNLISKSKIYNGPNAEIIHLHPVKELCDECGNRC